MTEKQTPLSAPLPSGFLADETAVKPAVIVAFTEGPAIDRDGNVYFSDIQNNRIMRLSPDGELSTFRADSGRANGNFIDSHGHLVTCEGAEFGPGGHRRVTRTDLQTGEVEVLTDSFEGVRYNSPNDLCVDSAGNIYFTDPCYSEWTGKDLGHESVYFLRPDRSVKRVVTQPAIQRPNGLALTPDERALYVVDSNPVVGGNRKIWRFEVTAPGELGEQRLIYDFGSGRGGDGMRLDQSGNLWIAAGLNQVRGPHESGTVPSGIYVVGPDGELHGRIPIPEDMVTNLTFGGPERKTLYVTAGRNLYRMEIGVSGYVPF